MPAPRIQADYSQLAQASRLFAQESGQTQALVQQMGQLVQALQGGGWVGRGANAFYAEMSDLVFPALRRLIGSLEDASSAALRISDIFQQAEQEAARCFDIDGGGAAGGGLSGNGTGIGGSGEAGGGRFDSALQDAVRQGVLTPQQAQMIKDGWAVLAGGRDVAERLAPFLLKNGGSIAGFLKKLGPGFDVAGGVLGGVMDWLNGSQDPVNGIGRGLFSGGVDLALNAATGGIYGTVIAVGDLTSLGGQAAVWGQQKLADMASLDPRMHAELSRGLSQSNEVFKGIRVGDTVSSLKNLVWDVGFRPGANLIHQGMQNGSALDVMRGVGMITDTMSPIGQFNMVKNFLSDPVAVDSAMQSGREFLSNAGNLVTSLPRLENEIFRTPLRMGVGAFNHAVNSLPISPGLRSTLNSASVGMAEFANNAWLPTPNGILGRGVEVISGWFK